MAAQLYASANAAFVDEDYEKAVQLYNEAIEAEDENAEYYSSRAQAFIKLNKYTEAVADAEKATKLNPQNTKAFLRLGIGQFHMKEYRAAKEALMSAKTSGESSESVDKWLEKCETELNILNAQDKVKVEKAETATTVKSTPDVPSSEVATEKANSPQAVPMPAGSKTRYDWYQTEKYVVVTILIKKLKKEDVTSNIQEKSVSLTVQLPTGSDYSLELDLAHPILPDQSVVRILSTKVEIKLKKSDGLHWLKLEGEDDHIKQIPVDSAAAASASSVMKYPSSSHHTRNWDQLVADIKEEEKDEKVEGDTALNNLFQQIYGDGNEEVRKAMNKSFVESGGTVLSTNWDEVGKKKVDMKPPDGMEYKKY